MPLLGARSFLAGVIRRSTPLRIAPFAALVAVLVTTGSSAAQMLPIAAPFPAPLSPAPGGDLGYVAPFSGFQLSAPLRLSLMGATPRLAGGFPQCATLEDDVGNSVGGIPVQHYWEWRFVPRLVLSGFTQLGCPIDAGIGAVVTYALPLDASSSLSLVFGAGAYVAPAQFQLFGGAAQSFALGLRSARSPAQTSARADLVWGPPDRQRNFGVQSLGTSTKVFSFGGGF
jgi:hypothetical protein